MHLVAVFSAVDRYFFGTDRASIITLVLLFQIFFDSFDVLNLIFDAYPYATTFILITSIPISLTQLFVCGIFNTYTRDCHAAVNYIENLNLESQSRRRYYIEPFFNRNNL